MEVMSFEIRETVKFFPSYLVGYVKSVDEFMRSDFSNFLSSGCSLSIIYFELMMSPLYSRVEKVLPAHFTIFWWMAITV